MYHEFLPFAVLQYFWQMHRWCSTKDKKKRAKRGIGIGIGIGLLKIHIAASKAELHEITV